MGASGAGKTTLLDVLAMRKTIGVVTGDILVRANPSVSNSNAVLLTANNWMVSEVSGPASGETRSILMDTFFFSRPAVLN